MDSHNSNPSRRPSAPRTPEQLRARARASEHRDALRRRARRIRRSVASLAAVLFSTAFLVIYVQLASGHDPALLANAKRAASASTSSGSSKAATTSTSTESATSSETESASSGESSSGSSSSSSEESSSGATAVTTSQS